MSTAVAAAIKAALLALTDENARKKIGWVLVAIFSPVILLIALLCSLASGGAEHNISVVELCFHGGALPADTPVEYREYICLLYTSASGGRYLQGHYLHRRVCPR